MVKQWYCTFDVQANMICQIPVGRRWILLLVVGSSHLKIDNCGEVRVQLTRLFLLMLPAGQSMRISPSSMHNSQISGLRFGVRTVGQTYHGGR